MPGSSSSINKQADFTSQASFNTHLFMTFFRATIFNLCFYGITCLMCVLCLPALLFPRKQMMKLVWLYVEIMYWIERRILGLDYEVRGTEHLPESGSYIIAAKHQSAYETMKLHHLFGDPGVILKRELTWIPIWGWFLNKCDMIPINRRDRETAIASIKEGALRMKGQGRPIIIFPQGTRVRTDTPSSQKRYKQGVVRIYEATDLPVIPMALNSGYYWPRKAWVKHPGTIIFQFLPPIPPGHVPEDVLKDIETQVETASNALASEVPDHLK